MSANERTGWRDKELSERHRLWGFNCPMVDLDFLAVEYHTGKPVLLADYKRFTAKEPDLRHPSYKAIALLADGYSNGPLPFIIPFYWPNIWAFRVIPVNEEARKHFYENEMLTEKEYVARLYRLRSLTLTRDLLPILNSTMPIEELHPATLANSSPAIASYA
jgi:hypothetical protein